MLLGRPARPGAKAKIAHRVAWRFQLTTNQPAHQRDGHRQRSPTGRPSRGSRPGLCQLRRMSPTPISRRINAPRSIVYRALLDARAVAAWPRTSTRPARAWPWRS